MVVYDVTFKVSYERTFRVDAGDEDDACGSAEDRARGELPPVSKLQMDLYSCEVARKDDDA